MTADYTFVYAVRPAPGAPARHRAENIGKPTAGAASLVTVRREVHFRLTRDNLSYHRLEDQPDRAAHRIHTSCAHNPVWCSSRF